MSNRHPSHRLPGDETARHELRLFLIALQFMTRVPVPAWAGYRPEWLNESARYFPLVGTVVGGVGALTLWAAALWWPPVVAVLLSIAATLLLTGAFHEDGFADVCDAFGGVVERRRMLEIMKDSRLGSYGVLGVAVLLGLKAAALAALPLPTACAALVLGHTVSRTAAVALIRWLPYAGDPKASKAKPLAQQLPGMGLRLALVWPLATLAGCLALSASGFWDPSGFAAPGAWLLACAVAAVTALACRRWFFIRLGGFTGDCLGAVQQLSELALYLAVLATFPVAPSA